MDSLNITKRRNSVDASEKNPVMRRKEEKKMKHKIFQRSCQRRTFFLWLIEIKGE